MAALTDPRQELFCQSLIRPGMSATLAYMEAYAAKRGPELFGNRKPFIMSDPAAYRRQATH